MLRRRLRFPAQTLRADLAEGRYTVAWGEPADLQREARAIATLDLRDFGAVTLKGEPEIWPRDL